MLTPNTTFKVNGVTVNEKIIPDGGSVSKANEKIAQVKFVTIHNTEDLKNVDDDPEQYTRATYNNAMGNTRIHFYVDDNGAWQNLKAGLGLSKNDPKGSAEVSYHVADTDDPTGGNRTSLSIEIVMGENAENDKKAYDNGARLAAYLLDLYGLGIDKLVTHTYWGNYGLRKKFSDIDKQCTNPNSGFRWCPAYIFNSTNPDVAYKNWKTFKETVRKYMKSGSTATSASSAIKYKPRLTSADRPEQGNKFYITKSNGGYNNSITGSPTDKWCNVLSNCVGYARGRLPEVLGDPSKFDLLPNNNAEDIYLGTSLKKGSVPKNGSLIVWKQGKNWNSSDGCGHIAFVEKVVSDNEIITSESAYGGSAFYVKNRKKGDGNWGAGSNFQLLGFIYPPVELVPCENAAVPDSSTASAPNTSTSFDFKVGDIVLFKGGYHYSSATTTTPTGGERSSGKAKVTGIAKNAKHQVHLIGENGGSDVYGWCDIADIDKTSKQATISDLKVGQIVAFTGGYHYVSSTAANPTGGKRTAGLAKVLRIAKSAKHPVSLVPTGSAGSSNVYGWVDIANIRI